MSWLPVWDGHGHDDGRATVVRRGHAHPTQAMRLLRYGRFAVVVPDHDAVAYCTTGWRFDRPVVNDRAADGTPVLGGWPWADLCALAAADWN